MVLHLSFVIIIFIQPNMVTNNFYNIFSTKLTDMYHFKTSHINKLALHKEEK